jgi:hypothetical protein
MKEDDLQALKIAFTFMPEQIEFVRGVLLDNNVDPDEVAGDINPDNTPNSCY